jgi:hypothetical protein
VLSGFFSYKRTPFLAYFEHPYPDSCSFKKSVSVEDAQLLSCYRCFECFIPCYLNVANRDEISRSPHHHVSLQHMEAAVLPNMDAGTVAAKFDHEVSFEITD